MSALWPHVVVFAVLAPITLRNQLSVYVGEMMCNLYVPIMKCTMFEWVIV